MAGIPKVKIQFDADLDGLKKGSKDATSEVETLGDKIADFGKKAAAAFALVGAAVGAFAVAAVKAAAEDEAAQKKLEQTIRTTTQATEDQIKGVEEYITQTSIAIGVTDDQLRPAFSRLVRSTKDVEDAQKLLNLALDLASATGKPLETTASALARAYDGNTLALSKLGLGIDQNTLKTQTFDKTFQQLTSTFGNFAENESETTAKQMERVRIALDEAKESIGAALLPVVQELTKWILENFIPALQAFVGGLTGNKGVTKALSESEKEAQKWGARIRGLIDWVIEYKDELLKVAAVIATVFVVSKIAAGVQATILLIQGLVAAYTALRNSATAAAIASRFALNPLAGLATGAAVVGAITAAIKLFDKESEQVGLSYNEQRAAQIAADAAAQRAAAATTVTTPSGGISGGISGKPAGTSGTTGAAAKVEVTEKSAKDIGESFANSFTQQIGGLGDVAGARFFEETGGQLRVPVTTAFDPARARMGEERSVINVTVNGALDPEAVSRQIVTILNDSQARGAIGGGGIRGAVAL